MNNVRPITFLVGSTTLHRRGLLMYLHATDQAGFMDDVYEAEQARLDEDTGETRALTDLEIMCSMYAKLCYRSLTVGKNANISRTRGIKDNIKHTIKCGHGSVFEHVWLNFITTDCSRVFTHELVRHRAGTAFSQTSGRYVRSDQLDMILDDPILSMEIDVTRWAGQDNPTTVREMLMVAAERGESFYKNIRDAISWDDMGRDEKKRMTSALRRILPNGQSNEIGWSANIRALRHMIQMRTSPQAEWEIRLIFSQVYELVSSLCPLLFFDADVQHCDDGTVIVSGMTTQPY